MITTGYFIEPRDMGSCCFLAQKAAWDAGQLAVEYALNGNVAGARAYAAMSASYANLYERIDNAPHTEFKPFSIATEDSL